MKSYTSEAIRNVALVGHGSCGKTTMLEALLFETGVTSRMGKIEDGNTVSDYDKMEQEKGYSINTAVVPVLWKDSKINFIDTPGYFDFVGEVNAALRAAESAVIVVDAAAGVEVGTEQAWKACEKYKMPRFIIINDKKKEAYDFDAVFANLKENFGDHLVPMDWPLGELDGDLKEAIAMTDDDLMEKFFNDEEFSAEEINQGMKNGIASGAIVPVLKTPFDLEKKNGEFLDMLLALAPNPLDHEAYKAVDGAGEEIEIEPSKDGPVSAFVFKTIIDPFVGKISILKIVSGKIEVGMELANERSGRSEKIGKLFMLRGNQQEEIQAGEAGDIVAVAKLQNTLSGDTLAAKDKPVKFLPLDYPKPALYIAVEAADKKDEDKVFTGLAKLTEEDPSFVIERNNETRQSLMGGQGEMQLGIIRSKLKDRFGVDVKTVPQKIAYRETIRGSSDVQGKHKKQSGGAGQYGDVHIKFEPTNEEFEFTESLFGGSIPKNYVPAVEKGLIESMEKGPLAGCKVVGIKADLYDGSYHDVDSNEMAFKIAASLAFKKGILEAKPCLLEPIMHLDIYVPDSNMGDVMGDMNKRRGKILGMEPQANGDQKVMAEAPQSELFDYAIALRSMTQARGYFEMHFERYEQVPQNLADKIIEEHKAEEE